MRDEYLADIICESVAIIVEQMVLIGCINVSKTVDILDKYLSSSD